MRVSSFKIMNGSYIFLIVKITGKLINISILCFHQDLKSKATITSCAQLQRHKDSSIAVVTNLSDLTDHSVTAVLLTGNKGKYKGHLICKEQ